MLLIRRVAEVSRNTFSFCDVICDENPDRTATISARPEPGVGFPFVPVPRLSPDYHFTAVVSVVNRRVASRFLYFVSKTDIPGHANKTDIPGQTDIPGHAKRGHTRTCKARFALRPEALSARIARGH
jgi:hypothetical protein